jgi:hypothetical protein
VWFAVGNVAAPSFATRPGPLAESLRLYPIRMLRRKGPMAGAAARAGSGFHSGRTWERSSLDPAMGDGRWAMGDGRWAMGDGRWETGDGRCDDEPATRMTTFLRRFLPVWGAGLAGVAGLAFLPLPPLAESAPTSTSGLSGWAVLAGPALLVSLGAALGAAFAHRAGLGSRLAGTTSGPFVAAGLGWGLAVAAAVGMADAAIAPALGDAWAAARTRAEASAGLPALAASLLYGGIAEEVMLRWGLAASLAFASAQAARAVGGRRFADGPWPARIGIAVAAVAFGAGHLPALAAEVTPTPLLALRTVALNAAAGLVYGWLAWRRGLEAAFTAHATTHAGWAAWRILA